MLIALIAIASITQVLVSLFVFSRDRRNLSNLLFFFIGIATLGWALSNYAAITVLNSDDIILVVRLILFFVVIQNVFFYMFARTFPDTRWRHSRKWLSAYLIFSGFVAALTLSPFVFTSVKIEDGLAVTQAGPGILAFIIHAALSISMAFRSLLKKARKASGLQKSHFKILIVASFLNWIVVPITNFALTPLLKTTIFIELGPLYTLVFASLVAYAIVAQKLFDIRRAVARSVAYLLSLGFIGVVYGGVIFLVSFFLVAGSVFNEADRAIYILLALFSAVVFNPTKRFFDKLTNKIFYRDAYDPQAFLDQLNDTLVTNIEIGILVRHTTSVIEENLKAECHVYLQQTDTARSRIMGTSKKDIPEETFDLIKAELATIKDTTVVTEELEEHYVDLKKALDAHDIAVISSLVTTYSGSHEATAYLLLGPKKSGNIYSSQDIRIINIISDELLIAIQNALRFEEIETFNVTLQKRIADATAKLKRSNDKLKEMDETKDEFISMASHQLRTPLTSVKGYLSMVLEGDAGKITPTQRQLLNQAFVSSQRMVYLIADLLNVSRLKTGRFIIEAVPTNLADMVESEIAQLKEVAKSRKLTLEYSKPKDFPELMLDETKTRQVVMNFVDNAIYYTPSGGHIKIELRTDRSSVYFMVKDDGLGVPKEDQSHLFTKFYRAKNAQKARPDGTGLGLFMAKKVITDQGGTILFESKEGKGSTFGFKFDKPKASLTPTK